MDITEKILDDLNLKIRHLTSAHLRANALYSLLNIELENCKDIDLLASSQDTIRMVDSMNKFESLSTISYSLILVKNFMKINNFEIEVITDPKVDSHKFQRVKAKIIKMIEIEPIDPVFF